MENKYDGSLGNVNPEIITNMEERLKEEEFRKYFYDCYNPKGLYSKTFPKGYTEEQFYLAYRLRLASGQFEGDSFDREAVRNAILASMNIPTLGL